MFHNKQALIGLYAASSSVETPTLWTFPTPPAGRTITGFSVTTDPPSTILVVWGDNTSNTINSGSLVNKTY